MHEPTTVQALFQDGPAEGAVRPVECGPDGRPPALLMLGGGKVYVESSTVPAPPEYPMYELADVVPTEGFWLYQYVETLTTG